MEAIASRVPWWSILGEILFNIFINDVGNITECTLIKFTDGTKLRGVADKLGGCAAFHLGKLKNWADRNLMELDKREYQFFHLGKNLLSMSVGRMQRGQNQTLFRNVQVQDKRQ